MHNTANRITQVHQGPGATSGCSPAPVTTPPAYSLEGRQIGRYELMYHIASGGMASVYAARMVGMAGFERLVAIKVIHPHLSREPAFIRMFLDEARLAARISHPNVAAILELGEEDGLYFMAVELVQGKDLNQVLTRALEKELPLPLSFGVEAIAQICGGLAEAHRLTDNHGKPLALVHRDVSTRNILISYTGHPRLIDFGAAFARDRLAHTATGFVKGKIGYMPPEQIRGEALDCRADIYSLGVVLYTAATGCHPFPYPNEAQQITHTLNGIFKKPSLVNRAVDPILEHIILTAMAAFPGDRFQSADAMKEQLENWLLVNKRQSDASPAQIMTTLFANQMRLEQTQIETHRQAQQHRQQIPLPNGQPDPTAHAQTPDKKKRYWLAIGLGVVTLLLATAVLLAQSRVTVSPDGQVPNPSPLVHAEDAAPSLVEPASTASTTQRVEDSSLSDAPQTPAGGNAPAGRSLADQHPRGGQPSGLTTAAPKETARPRRSRDFARRPTTAPETAPVLPGLTFESNPFEPASPSDGLIESEAQ